ncbi:flagellar basal body P-ring protein FlgI [candidate division GN15 bacterium]|nr:flagellar basal body P-ring protein FlgI [candidate division GN15 bacterium]
MLMMIYNRLLLPVGLTAIVWLIMLLAPSAEGARVRIKDIAAFQNTQDVDLLGYGLVVGLDGTGDGNGTQFTTQSLVNMMERMGLTVDPDDVKVKNVAAVMVTARISSDYAQGSYIDVTVSSLGDASSLQGGTLLLTQLSDPNGQVRATAQGPVSIGGFNVQVDEGNKIFNNYTLVGRVPNGGRIVNPVMPTPGSEKELYLSLRTPDPTTSHRVAERINIKYGHVAYPVDGGTVRVIVPDTLMYPTLRMEFISDIGHLQVVPDQTARVVINEKTGTIVAGQFVKIEPVAIAHGTITVSIQSSPIISQPAPFSQGETVVTQEPSINVQQDVARVVHLEESVYLSDVASALNRIGATPRDIVAIFQALKQAGALQAELVIM